MNIFPKGGKSQIDSPKVHPHGLRTRNYKTTKVPPALVFYDSIKERKRLQEVEAARFWAGLRILLQQK